MGRVRFALPLAVALVATGAKPAAAAVFDLRPSLTLGATDNAFGLSESQSAPTWEEFATAGLAAQLQVNEARSTHHLTYDIARTWYRDTTLANNTAHAAFWISTFDLSGKTTLSLGATASLFSYSAIVGVDPALGNPTGVPIGTVPTTVLIYSGTESLTYVRNGREKYVESFTALRFDPLTTGATLPTTTSLTASGRADRQVGVNGWSLTLTGSDYIIDSMTLTPPSAFVAGSVLTAEALVGWRRDISANSSVEVSAGPLAFYSIDVHSLAIGPAVTASASYRHLPWYASLTVSQQPTVNIYLGQALLADSAIARVALPLDKRESLTVVGIAGYTYARSISGSQHFLFAPRAYDLFVLDAGIAYHFQRAPLFASADYSVNTQRGSLSDGISTPSTLRRIISLSVGGDLSWGEGARGWRTAAAGH